MGLHQVQYDLWSTEQAAKPKHRLKNPRLHPSNKRSKQITLPHPGQSYNPDPDDHAKLLKRIAQKELQYQKEQTAINRALHVQKKVNAKELQKHEHQELVSGIQHLIADIKKDEDSGDETDSVYSEYDEKDFEVILKDKRVKEERKTKQQRAAQLRDKMQRKAAKLRKSNNVRLSKLDSIKRISKELDKKAAEKRAKKHRKTRNERLGTKFEPSDPVYCLKSELPSNLRQASSQMASIVREQFESFQSRLLVEPTKPQIKKRKYKRKQFERQSDD